MTQFTKDERKALLRFVTSSASPPFGVQTSAHRSPCTKCGDVTLAASLGLAKDVERLPTASTCFNILKLPNFRRLETMKAKLRTAMHAGAGFELSKRAGGKRALFSFVPYSRRLATIKY